MAWYRTGTVTVNNNSATVTGVGTLFVDNGTLNPGDIFFAPDAKDYEIASIQSNTQFTLVTPYLGANAAGASYAIAPIGLLPSALALQVKSTLALASQASAAAILSTPAQGLTTAQQANARANIGAMAAGPIDAISIGATTPSTGAFTTLSATGASTLAALTASGLITASAGLTSTAGTTNLGATNTASLVSAGIVAAGTNLQVGSAAANDYLIKPGVTGAGTGSLAIQAGAGSIGYGGSLKLYSHSHATLPGWVIAGISSGSGGKFSVQNSAIGAGTDMFTVDALGNVANIGTLTTGAPAKLSPGYTVATLPAGTLGQRAFVNDAVSPSYLGALTGGGTVKCAVFHNGTSWVSC